MEAYAATGLELSGLATRSRDVMQTSQIIALCAMFEQQRREGVIADISAGGQASVQHPRGLA